MTKRIILLGGIFLSVFVVTVLFMRPATDDGSVRVTESLVDIHPKEQRMDHSTATTSTPSVDAATASVGQQDENAMLQAAPQYVRDGIYDDADDLEDGQYRVFLSEPYSSRPDAAVAENWDKEQPVAISDELEPGQSRTVVEGVKPADVINLSLPDTDTSVVTGADPYYLEPGQERTILGPPPADMSYTNDSYTD